MLCKYGIHICKETLTKLRDSKEGLQESHKDLLNFSMTTLKDRRLRGDLIEIYKVTSRRESINWVKQLNLRKNVDIYGPAANVRENSLNLRKESFSSRIINSLCSWTTVRDNFFVTSPLRNFFKSDIEGQFKKIGCYSF